MPPSNLTISYAGEKGPVFWLALRTGILTVLTLGFYRFWAKTRLRRYYWSAIRPGGAPLEYVGDPLEKLLGFLVAVVFMAFYIGIVNLILMYFSFALLNANYAAYALSFLGLTPDHLLRPVSRPPLHPCPHPLAGYPLWAGARRVGL